MPVKMTIQVKPIAAMILVSAILLSASGHPQHQGLSDTLFRRQVQQPECTSYSDLQGLMTRRFMEYARNTVQKLFSSGPPVTRSKMRVVSVSLCREMSMVAVDVRREIQNCSNVDEITANFHVFGGLCLENGTMTNLLDSLLTGFGSVNYEWGSVCSEQMEPAVHECRHVWGNPSTSIQDGPNEYKRNFIEQEHCVSEGLDNANLAACGDVQSLKRLYIMFSLFIPVAPGVTFQLSEFHL